MGVVGRKRRQNLGCVLSLAIMAGLADPGLAQERRWRNPTAGDWSSAASWVGSTVPGTGETANFGLSGSTSPFTVTFSGNVSTHHLTVGNQRPEFDLAGFTYQVANNIIVGGINTPGLAVLNGLLQGNWVVVGNNSGQPGALQVDGPNARLLGLDRVGITTGGQVTVSNGADASTGDRQLILGENAGAAGTVTVQDADSTFRAENAYLVVGRHGAGVLTGAGGARILAGGLAAGNGSGTGLVTLRGAGTELQNQQLHLYNATDGGQGTIIVEQGARLTSPSVVHAGSNLGSIGAFIVRDHPSEMAAQYLQLGEGGEGRLEVSNGGRVDVEQWMDLSRDSSTSTSQLIVSGPGSQVTVSSGIATSGGGKATLSILDGGSLITGDLSNWGENTEASYLVSGQGSVLAQTGNGAYIGWAGSRASLIVTEGGTVEAKFIEVGAGSGSEGTVHAAGSGSLVSTTESLIRLGWAQGAGSLKVTDGAAVSCRGLAVDSNPAGQDNVVVDGPGSLLTTTEWGWHCGDDARAVVRNGGGVEIQNVIGLGGQGGHAPQIVIDGASSYVYTPSRVDVGGWDLGYQPSGTITLLNGGQLITDDYLNMMRGSRLEGDGIVSGGNVNHGTVAPGRNIGHLIYTWNYSQSSWGALEIDIAGVGSEAEYDRVTVAGDAHLDGTLHVRPADDYTPVTGDSLQILTSTGKRYGTFSRLAGADAGPGLAFIPAYADQAVTIGVRAVNGLAVDPPGGVSLYAGFQQSLTARADLGNGEWIDITASTQWSSDDDSVANVNTEGVVEGTGAGTTTLRARFAGFEAIVAVSVQGVASPSNSRPGLLAEYFELTRPPFESMTPVKTVTRASIDLPYSGAFGGEFADSGLTRDFAAILTGKLIIPAAGTYEFLCEIDWGWARLLVGGVPVAVKDWWAGHLAAELELESGEVDVQVELYKGGDYGATAAILSWGSDSIAQEPVPASAWVAPGVACDYFSIEGVIPPLPTDVPDLSDQVVFYSAVVPDLNFPDNLNPPFTGLLGPDTAVRFSGHLTTTQTGDYTFYLRADDGARVYIDDVPILYTHSGLGHTVSTSLSLGEGFHKVRVDAYERGYSHGLVLEIEGPGIGRQPVPSSVFSHGGTPRRGAADLDGDGEVDAGDLILLQSCAAGPAIPHAPSMLCGDADFDGDGDVDQSDFGMFQRCMAGAGRSADPGCLN